VEACAHGPRSDAGAGFSAVLVVNPNVNVHVNEFSEPFAFRFAFTSLHGGHD
jgi:hypothetical protein